MNDVSEPKGCVLELHPPVVHKAVVEELRALLSRAEAGEITGFAMAFAGPSGNVGSLFGGTFDEQRAIGALEVLKFRLAREFTRDRGEE